MPHIHTITSKLHDMEINLFKAFHQIPMNPDDVEKTAVATPFGTFQCLCQLVFGMDPQLRNDTWRTFL